MRTASGSSGEEAVRGPAEVRPERTGGRISIEAWRLGGLLVGGRSATRTAR